MNKSYRKYCTLCERSTNLLRKKKELNYSIYMERGQLQDIQRSMDKHILNYFIHLTTENKYIMVSKQKKEKMTSLISILEIIIL